MKTEKIIKSIYDITPEFIKSHNIKGMLVDMDNTLLPWDQVKISKESIEWLDSIKKCDVKICVITNSGLERTSTVLSETGLDYIHTALKPLPFSFIKGRKKLGVNRKNIIVVGDQMVTDALGAKIVGYKYIIVEPMSKKEHKWTAVNRFFERVIFRRDVRKTDENK